MMFYLMATTTAVLLLFLIAPSLFKKQRIKDLNFQNSRVYSRFYKSNRNIKKLIDEKILSGEVSQVEQLNAELELHYVFEPMQMPENVINKVFEILYSDRNACYLEKLMSLEYLHGQVRVEHLPLIKELFERYGKTNYLFDIELYKLVGGIPDHESKQEVLDWIATQVTLTPDLIEQASNQTK